MSHLALELIEKEKQERTGKLDLGNLSGLQSLDLSSNQISDYTFDPTTSTKFLSIDLIAREFPELTPNQLASDSPIANIDLDGLERYWPIQLKLPLNLNNNYAKIFYKNIFTFWLFVAFFL